VAGAESKFQGKVIKWFESCAAKCFHIHGNVFQQDGIPDLFVAHRVWHGWIELKVDKHQCEPLQRKFIKDLRDRYVSVAVLRGFTGSRDVALELEDGTEIRRWVVDLRSSEDALMVLRGLSLFVSDRDRG
jgi:hypothetical protein